VRSVCIPRNALQQRCCVDSNNISKARHHGMRLLLCRVDEAMERAPLPSEGSISIPVVRDESATAQSAVTEQLAHLSTAPKRTPLQSQPRTPSTAPAIGPVPMESSSSKPARKQSQEAKPVFDAEWDDEDAVPDDKRLFTVSCRQHLSGVAVPASSVIQLAAAFPSPLASDLLLWPAGADPPAARLCNPSRILTARSRGTRAAAERHEICGGPGACLPILPWALFVHRTAGLQFADGRICMLQFVTAEAAQMAMARLNGTDICGEALTISVTDPLQNERNSKRPRVAE